MARHPFTAVNLISDPIHGYVELTKTLARDESAAAGLPDEDVAEEDLLEVRRRRDHGEDDVEAAQLGDRVGHPRARLGQRLRSCADPLRERARASPEPGSPLIGQRAAITTSKVA